MTNREELAKAAFGAMLSNPAVINACLKEGGDIETCVGDIAALAVKGADVLAAHLEQRA